MQRALILSNASSIEVGDISLDEEEVNVKTLFSLPDEACPATPKLLDQDMKKKERELIVRALEAGNGSRKDAAARLGISPRTLRYKIARLRDAGMELPAPAGAGGGL